MRFFGKVGYGESQETLVEPDVYEDVITEVDCTGDVMRVGVNTDPGTNVVNDLKVNNYFSVVYNDAVEHHVSTIKYVEWYGVLWTVTSVEVRPPRLLLNIGEVYNGPRP